MRLLYKCNWCDTFFNEKNKRIGAKHEKECVNNPKNRTCYSCTHLRAEFMELLCNKKNKLDDLQSDCKDWEPKYILEDKCFECGCTLSEGVCRECEREENV